MSSVLTGVAIIALVLLVLWAGQRRLLYFPFGEVPAPAEVGLASAERVTFSTADGLTLHGWFVPARTPRAATVIVFNGNAGHRGLRAPLATALNAQGIAVLLFDYRGYGGNPGTPTEAGLFQDARAAQAYVASRPDVDATRVVYFGESLGSGVATALAAEKPPAALILRSPFASMAEVGQFHYPLLPVRWLLRDRFASIEHISRIGCPLLVIAGDRDRVVPFDHSRRLFDAASEPKTFVTVPGADHNDWELTAGDLMLREIGRLLATVGR